MSTGGCWGSIGTWPTPTRTSANIHTARRSLADSSLGRSTVEDATATLNAQVFGDIGMSDGQARALVESIDTLRRRAGDF